MISFYQVWECYNPGRCVPPVERPDTGWSIVRSPRAMIMLRAGKVFVYKLNLPRELLRKIFRLVPIEWMAVCESITLEQVSLCVCDCACVRACVHACHE